MENNTSYSSPKVEMRGSSISGRGLFAKGLIKRGKLIVDFNGGKGKFVDSSEADRLYSHGDDYFLQVENNLYFAATRKDEIENEDYINHSCNPNCGIRGSLQIVAMRDIKLDEEITFDYAMSESSNYRMNCNCGSDNCRKVITGNDWKITELQNKFRGYFSEYLRRKIDKIAI